MRKITMTLDPTSVRKAIREVEIFQKELRTACALLVQRLTDEGVEIAKVMVSDFPAIDTGELMDSIHGYYSPHLRAGFIKVGARYGVFVEYGTGVVGGENPHPDPANWVYDSHGHGEKGWVYHSDRDGKFHWTKGYYARPFMYNTLKELKRMAPEEAREIFMNL